MSKSKRKSHNEKVAEQLTVLVNDVTLDLDQIGEYIAHRASNVSYRRLIEVAETAKYEREEKANETGFVW